MASRVVPVLPRLTIPWSVAGPPQQAFQVVNKLFFMYDGYKPGIPSTATGREPWVSDGTNVAPYW